MNMNGRLRVFFSNWSLIFVLWLFVAIVALAITLA